MEHIEKNVKERKKSIAKKNNKKNYNLALVPRKNISDKVKGKGNRTKRKGGTASVAMQNSATITCTMVVDPSRTTEENHPVTNRFVVVAYPAKGIDGEIFGPFETAQQSIHAALEYLKPLFDEKTENIYVKGIGGSTQRYPVIGGEIQHV